MPEYADLTLERGKKLASDEQEQELLDQLSTRIQSIRQEHEFFRQWCSRADKLFYADVFTDGGADLWPDDRSATVKGRSHVSVNTPSVYVTIPASLQAVEPIENMLSTKNTAESRTAASNTERAFTAWKMETDFELKFSKACIVKGLYGRTAGRITWEDGEGDEKGHPEVEIVEQPRNLYLGYKTDEYNALEWAAYVMRYEPNALMEAYGVDVTKMTLPDGRAMPVLRVPVEVSFGTLDSQPPRSWLDWGDARVEVWDYWYRKPVFKRGKFTHMVTCNAVIAGNVILQGPDEYPEYEGDLPYIPLLNSFIPGVPTGRSDLHDAEQIIREKYEKITAGSQMIANGVAGDYWQLIGPDAPIRVPASLKPKRNELVGPGPGNRIETITPFIAQFQLEQYLGRLDRELAVVSGLNDLLLGLAPAQVLSSSKAINALIANYEARLAMPRKLLYKWRREMWELAAKVFAHKDEAFKSIMDAGGGRLDITDPSLSPRDDMETATRASNLVSAKLWSQARAMDAVGVDDPETEQDLIREESTDATLWPERVQVMAQLMGALQALGLNAPEGAQEQAAGQAASGQQDLRAALGAQTPDNTTGSQSPDTQGQTPPIPGAPPEAGGAFASGPPAAQPPLMQGMLANGEAKGRIMTQQTLGRR
jgi:hypothetical protein